MEKPAIKHFNINIIGKVQGVGFRYSARSFARALGVTGFVRNMPDRSVYIEAEGTELQLTEFLQWCHEGPAHSRVLNVIHSVSDLKNYQDFEIR